MKTFIVILLILLCAASLYLAYYFNQHSASDRSELNKERYSRMVAEEGLQKASEKIAALENTVDRKEDRIDSLEKMLKDQKFLNSELQKRVDNEINARDALNVKIKELEKVVSDLSKSPQTQAGY